MIIVSIVVSFFYSSYYSYSHSHTNILYYAALTSAYIVPMI